MRTPLLLTAAAVVAVAGPVSAQTDAEPHYCVDGFVQTDTNDDGLVSPQEVSDAAAVEFSALDTDESGRVTLEEFSACRLQPYSAITDGVEMRNIETFDEADLDDDGMISQQEYLVVTRQIVEELPAANTDFDPAFARPFIYLPKAEEDRLSQMSADETAARSYIAFFLLDSEDPRGLSGDEWKRGMALRNDISEVLNMQFEAADADASGDITIEEYIAANRERAEAAGKRAAEQGLIDADAYANPPVVFYRYEQPM